MLEAAPLACAARQDKPCGASGLAVRRASLKAGVRNGWNRRAGPANRHWMVRLAFLAAPALVLASVSGAAPGGPIGTLPLGAYVCELPGDATGPAGERKPEADFTVTNASSYRAAAGKGIYLLTGDRMVFTSGPLDGVKYHRTGPGFLRRTEADGKDGPLRCVRQVGNNR